MMRLLLFILNILWLGIGNAQQPTKELDYDMFWQNDTLFRQYKLDEVVVSATRMERHLGSLSVPVQVIDAEVIRQAGYLRLQDALQEQTGLQLVYDHGVGIQIQGLDADYTLIMIDGEPLIGRVAGTLDLSRLNITDIKRIEIMRGPSSALYGSEALAGVINIITGDDQAPGHRLQSSLRYGSMHIRHFQLKAATTTDKLQASASWNFYGNDGYDYQPNTYGATLSPFYNHTLRTSIRYDWSQAWTLRLSARLFEEHIRDAFQQGSTKIDGHAYLADRNLLATLEWAPDDRLFLQFRNYITDYRTRERFWYKDSTALFDQTFFDQLFWRPEVFMQWAIHQKQTLSGGVGLNEEYVEASRYEGRKRMYNLYAYVQHEWHIAHSWHIHTGARLDHHSIYGTQLSPKWGVRWQQNKLGARLAVGRGFKAPDFRQLYLNFTNNSAGYTVLGTEEVRTGIRHLLEQGLIQQILLDPEQVAMLRPESSWAVNLGADWRANERLSVEINLFRNDLRNMIDTQPVARRTNGQFVFSYRNLNRVVTQGIEYEMRYRLGRYWQLAAGYQYLDAFEPEVIERIERGEIFTRDPQTLVSRRVRREEYGGLFNRSRHSANLKVFFKHPTWQASGRLIYRGRYGWGDANGNLILDDSREYVKGYALLNLSLGYRWKRFYQIQAGIDNTLDYRDPEWIPALPPRAIWLSLHVDIR